MRPAYTFGRSLPEDFTRGTQSTFNTETAWSLHVWASRAICWGMWTRFSVAAHLGAEELAVRYRAARDPVERSRWQMLWLLVSGRRLGEVAAVTGYSSRWIREVVKRYNACLPISGTGTG